MAIKDIKFIKTSIDKMNSYSVEGHEENGVGKIYENSIIQVSDEDGHKDLYIGDSKMTDNYNSHAEDEWESVKVGGLESTTAEVLKSKSTSELLDAILFPTYPAEIKQPVVAGSCSITNGIIEVGATLPTIDEVKEACGFTTISRGTSKYGVLDGDTWVKGVQDYAGEITDEQINVISEDESRTVAVADSNAYEITYSVTFESGNQPTNNKGGADGTPFAGGTISATKTITLKGIYPMYCNGAWISTTESVASNAAWLESPAEAPVKKLEDTNIVAVSFAPQTKKDGVYQEPFRLYLYKKAIDSIETLSDLSGKWDANTNRGSFTKSGTKSFEAPNGESITYDIWQFVLEGTGNAKIKFKLKNA